MTAIRGGDDLYSMSDIEYHFMRSQHEAQNLTTFEVYPFPSSLAEVAYPLDAKGCLVPPSLLEMHSRSHNFPIPKCFHGRDSVFIVTRNNHGTKRDLVDFICGNHGQGNDCKFRIDVNKLIRDSVSLTCTRYTMRRGVTSVSNTSLGLMSSWSLPSFESPRNNSRMSDVGIEADGDGGHNDDTTGTSNVVDDSCSDGSYEDLCTDAFGVPRYTQQSLEYSGHAPTDHAPFNDFVGTGSIREEVDDLHGTVKKSDVLDNAAQSGDPRVDEEFEQNYMGLFGVAPTLAKASETTGVVFNEYSDPTQDERMVEDVGAVGPHDSNHDMFDGDTYPLLTRPDGTPSITSCIDPVTHDFSNDMFIAQILKDSSWGRKVVVY